MGTTKLPKDFASMVKRLEREGLVIGRETGSKHTILVLRGGHRYACAGTPSDWRSLANTESQIKRLTRQQAPGYTGSALKRNGNPER
jgi:hypothetical protein